MSKSGTNQYHGSVYEFLRNNDLDANNFFNNQAGIPVSIYKQNDFGATVGGPVWIPKVYNGRNRTFFFFSYEGFRNRTGANGAQFTVPTPEMYNGDFSKWVTAAGVQIPIYNPLAQTQNADGTYTRPVFPGNVIPKNLFSASAVKALGVFQASGTLTPNTARRPAPTDTSTTTSSRLRAHRSIRSTSTASRATTSSARSTASPAITATTASTRRPGPDGPPTLPGLYSTYNDLAQATDVVRFSWDWSMSANKLNHFFAGGNNWRQDHKPPQEYIGNWKSKFCLPNVPDCNENLVNLFSGGTGNNYSTWGGQADNGSENTVYAYNDDFTWIHGKHTFKFGGMFQINHYNGFGRQCEAGCVGFSYQETGVPGGSNPTAGGNAFASFLLGLGGQRPDRHGALHRPAVLLFRRLRARRLARQLQAGAEPGPALGPQPAADRLERPLERFLADDAESRPRATSRARCCSPDRDRAASVRARWRICGPRDSGRTSGLPIRRIRRPRSAGRTRVRSAASCR